MTTANIDSTIEAVTVYQDRARVTRRGSGEVSAGVQKLILGGFPLRMDRDSVRVTGEGSTAVRILSVDVTQQFFEQSPAAQVKALEEAIQEVADELSKLNGRESVLSRHAKHIDSLLQETESYAFGLSRGRHSIEKQHELLTYLREQGEALQNELLEIEQAKRPLNDRLAKLKKELAQLQNVRPKRRQQVVVEVEAAAEGTFEPQISYVVNNASWRPLYDVRLQTTNGSSPSLSLSYIAQITQQTGEDWEDVSLTVSTARPALNQHLPELKPWYVDVYRPRPRPQAKRRGAITGSMMRAEMDDEAPQAEAMPMAMAAPAPAMVAADVSVAEVESSGTAVTFKVGGSTNIPGDGSPHKTTVAEYNFRPKIDYVAVPKHTDAVYRRVTVTNESQSPLLAGPVNLFMENEFIGKNQLSYAATGGEFELMLGVEERVTIGREMVKREVDKRFFGDKRRLRYGYEMTIENLMAENAIVTVRDHIPVSRHEDIKVTLQDVNIQPKEQTDLNELEWELTLQGQSKQIIRYEYLVEHPRSLEVTGLID